MDHLTLTHGFANQACKRCHSRKKKCNRALPQCETCRQSSVQCSFLDLNDETGVFSVSYVRSLEKKVTQLESQVRRLSAIAAGDTSVAQSSSHRASVSSREEQSPVRYAGSGSLARELKLLSLEATAERYLGQSSGLSFARLTQAVLKRLRSDQYPFDFDSPAEEERQVTDVEHDALNASDALDAQAIDTSVQFADPVFSIGEKQAHYLADCYWSHNHSLYPFLRKVAFMNNLKRMYARSQDMDLQSSTWLYTFWMVMAIGSTARSSVMVDDESESVQHFDRAMSNFEGALGVGSIAALSAILLQVSYSFFNKVGPNTWYLVGVGVRIAIGIGLHTAPSTAAKALPVDIQENRKRLFYSLYMMDRLVSISLGRPFGIQDSDIEIDLFVSADDENILSDRIVPQSRFQPSAAAVPLHIVSLRKICGRIFEQVYSSRNRDLPAAARDEILQTLHRDLVDWRRDMPFPLPQSKSLPIPHFSTAWYDLNYYQHLLMLYRPSPLFPVLTLEKVGLIAEAATMFIHQVAIMKRQTRFAFNWLNLFSVFTATLTLIYSITAQPEPLPDYLRRTNVLGDLTTVDELLATFGRKFPSALKCRSIVQDVKRRLEATLDQTSPAVAMTPENEVSTANLTNWSGSPAFSEPSQGHNDPTSLAYPVYNTGNVPYDELQQKMQGVESPATSGGMDAAMSSLSEGTRNGLLDDFELSSTRFGSAAAHFMATGFGTSADMDMDGELMQFIGATSDGWNV